MKILPYEATSKFVSNIHFIRGGFEKLEDGDVIELEYEPNSFYHEDCIENVMTLKIRYLTEYPSAEAKKTMRKHLEEPRKAKPYPPIDRKAAAYRGKRTGK